MLPLGSNKVTSSDLMFFPLGQPFVSPRAFSLLGFAVPPTPCSPQSHERWIHFILLYMYFLIQKLPFCFSVFCFPNLGFYIY